MPRRNQSHAARGRPLLRRSSGRRARSVRQAPSGHACNHAQPPARPLLVAPGAPLACGRVTRPALGAGSARPWRGSLAPHRSQRAATHRACCHTQRRGRQQPAIVTTCTMRCKSMQDVIARPQHKQMPLSSAHEAESGGGGFHASQQGRASRPARRPPRRRGARAPARLRRPRRRPRRRGGRWTGLSGLDSLCGWEKVGGGCGGGFGGM